MKILITGITGSSGSYLSDYFRDKHPEVEVHGISRWHKGSKILENVHECDLLDLSSIVRVLREVKPDTIYHLASYANVRASFDTPLAVINNNVMGTANLLEAVRLELPECKFYVCSTSEVYGNPDKDHIPMSEFTPINPINPYAVSKTTQDFLANVYYKSYGLKIIRTRMFTYLNPRRNDLFATSFALQIAKCEAGLQDVVKHGNLDSTRTLLDVRDAMASYWYATEYCNPGDVYNVGGDYIITVGEFLEKLKSLAKCNIKSELDPTLLRPIDLTMLVPDSRRFREKTGWKPQYSVDESIQFLLDECRRQICGS